MKNIFILILFFTCLNTYAQVSDYESIEIPDSMVLNNADILPKIKGGHSQFISIMHGIRYPKLAIENEIQGDVLIKLTIDSTGKILTPIILSSEHEYLTEAVVTHVNKLSNNCKLLPAISNNQKINFDFKFPFKFRLY